MIKSMTVKCDECPRVFDLVDEAQAEEFYYGHDCEIETETKFATIQEILDGAYEKFGGWSMSANDVINWIATELDALEEAN
jgi:hypothetical protein